MDEMVIGSKDALRRLQGDKELLLELIEIFLEDAHNRLKNIDWLIGQGDLRKLAEEVHTLKGAASNIGAQKLWKSFCEIEEMIKQKNFGEVKKIFKRASIEFTELEEYFPTLKAQLLS